MTDLRMGPGIPALCLKSSFVGPYKKAMEGEKLALSSFTSCVKAIHEHFGNKREPTTKCAISDCKAWAD